MMTFRFGRRDVRISKVNIGIAIGVLWIAIISGIAFLLYLVKHSIDQASARLSDQATAYAHLIAEHDRFSFRMADSILRDLANHLTPDDFLKPISQERRSHILELLRDHRDRLPGIASFTLINSKGTRIVGVIGQDGTDFGDLGYFKANRDGQELFISNMEDDRASGKPGIHVSRRFSAPDGAFCGSIQLTLSAEDVFFAYYRTLNLGSNSTATLRAPQRLLISFPKYILSEDRIQGRDDVGRQIAAGLDSGVLTFIDPIDHRGKVTAFERLEGTNFYATVSLPTGQAMSDADALAWGAILAACACLVGAIGASSAIVRSHALATARESAEKAHRERQMLVHKLQSVAEEERRSISHEIHDVLNAIAIRVRNDAQGIIKLAASGRQDATLAEIAERAASISENTNDLYTQGRALVKRLRPEILDVLGLDQAVDEMVRGYGVAHQDCIFSFQSAGDMSRLENRVSIAAYRIVQEALSNVIKHAGATAVNVSLKHYSENGLLEIAVEDNGRGYDSTTPTDGIGLVGMRERVAAFHGTLEIRTGVNAGTRIFATISLPQGSPPA
ncbi:ATP-binding protein [Azohydromonas australica]|uniref:ATP-binding protein n=1 Tax=Azohydromonas australica TaxID=364039 RepID=UPI0003F8AE84|nr:ATP-binding protein [Azohydromonas australica]